jgi:hypothetical protein
LISQNNYIPKIANTFKVWTNVRVRPIFWRRPISTVWPKEVWPMPALN